MSHRFILGSLVVMLLGPAAWAVQEAVVPAHTDRPSALAEVDGNVVSVDVVKQQLHIKDTHGELMTLQITKSTVISISGSSHLILKDLKPNDKVHAYYMTADNKARQIDVSTKRPIMKELETR